VSSTPHTDKSRIAPSDEEVDAHVVDAPASNDSVVTTRVDGVKAPLNDGTPRSRIQKWNIFGLLKWP
jgi:hypothetical protein